MGDSGVFFRPRKMASIMLHKDTLRLLSVVVALSIKFDGTHHPSLFAKIVMWFMCCQSSPQIETPMLVPK